MMEGAAMDTAMERAQAILADDPEERAQKERLAQVEETRRARSSRRCGPSTTPRSR